MRHQKSLHPQVIRGLTAIAVVAAVAATSGCVRSSPQPAPPPAESQLVVTPNGIRDLRIGLPVTAYGLVSYGEHACPTTGGWLPHYPQDENNSSGQELDPFDIHTRAGSQSGQIQSVFVWSKKIQTAKGIHVGSALADVQAAYPAAATKKGYSTVMYVVPGTRGQLVIELAGHNEDAVGEWPRSLLDTVVWMDVVPRHTEVESIAGNDDAGPCPVKGHLGQVDDDDDD